ncbi:transcription factor CP2-like protein 1 [Neosynchiropus ocellatus]
MLFCPPQPETFAHSSSYIREALAPFLKHEEALARQEDVVTPFQHVLCAATSPAVKQLDETLTYLNQGQSYEVRLGRRRRGDHADAGGRFVKSVVRVVFHDRRLQYTEHQQLEGWRCSRPGDRLLDMDIPLSVGVLEPHSHPLHLNAVDFLWDPAKGASVYIQVNCVSTEFTLRKHGGEKGAPFRIQVDTYGSGALGDYTERLHSSSCQVKVFKPKGADRKLKTDKEKVDKKLPQDKEKYQQSRETTDLKECCAWPDVLGLSRTPSPVRRDSPASSAFSDGSCSPGPQGEPLTAGCSDGLLASSTPQQTQLWLRRHRFSSLSQLLSSFSGADLLRMTKDDLVQVCGPGDGIRLFNSLRARCVRPRLTVYVGQQPVTSGVGSGWVPDLSVPSAVYQALYLEELTLLDLRQKMASLLGVSAPRITGIYSQNAAGILVLVSDQMVQNIRQESSFIITAVRGDPGDTLQVVLT